MAEIPKGWEVVTPEKPGGTPPGWEVVGKSKGLGDEFGDTAAITAGGLVKGAREGGNPLSIMEGIIRLGMLGRPFVADAAMKYTGADDLLAGAADWLAKNKSITDPIRGWTGKEHIAEAFKTFTGLDPRTDLASPEAAYTATGAEKTTLRDSLAAAARVVGGAIPTAVVPGFAGANMLKAVGLSATGAGAGEAVGGEKGALLGSVLAPLAAPAVFATVRGVLRGTSGDRTAELIRDFERAGTTPSMGQVTGSYPLSGIESTTGRFGAVSHMQKFGEKQAAQMGERAETLAGTLSRPMDKETLGRYVRTGLTGPGGFIEKTQQRTTKLYSDVEKYTPGNTPIMLPNFIAYLNNAIGNPGRSALVAAATTESTKRLSPYLKAAGTDMFLSGTIPFSDVRLLLTRVGKKIDDGIINGDVTVQEAKTMYATLSKDVKDSLASATPPVYAATASPALRAWERATNYYAARMARLEQTIVPLVEGRAPEKIISAIDRSKKEGATTIRAVYHSLEPETRNMLTARTIRDLGRATPGAQNAEGAIFSPAQFVTRWNNITPEARRIMLDGSGHRELRFALESFARAASAIKQGSTVLQNKSGTAAAVYNLAAWIGGPTGGGLVGHALAGEVGAAGGIAATWMGMNLLGHLMTKPAAVRWLARSTTMPAETWAVTGQGLAARYPELKETIDGILTSPTGR